MTRSDPWCSRHPKPVIPPLFRLFGQLNGVFKGYGRGFSPVRRALVQDVQLQNRVFPSWIFCHLVTGNRQGLSLNCGLRRRGAFQKLEPIAIRVLHITTLPGQRIGGVMTHGRRADEPDSLAGEFIVK